MATSPPLFRAALAALAAVGLPILSGSVLADPPVVELSLSGLRLGMPFSEAVERSMAAEPQWGTNPRMAAAARDAKTGCVSAAHGGPDALLGSVSLRSPTEATPGQPAPAGPATYLLIIGCRMEAAGPVVSDVLLQQDWPKGQGADSVLAALENARGKSHKLGMGFDAGLPPALASEGESGAVWSAPPLPGHPHPQRLASAYADLGFGVSVISVLDEKEHGPLAPRLETAGR